MSIASFQWNFLSGSDTGASTTIFDNIGLRLCQNFTVTMVCGSPTGTCSFGIEVGAASTSGFVRMGSTKYDLSSGTAQVYQWSGPVRAIRPYLVGRTDSNVTCYVTLDGN